MDVRLTTEPARADRANEDFVAATPQAVVLLDGVGTTNSESGCVHGTPWYVHQLGTHLLTSLATRLGQPLAELLADAIAAIRVIHADSCDVDHPGTPSSTVILLRHHGEGLDYLVLADSVLLLDTTDGLQVITDDREQAVSQRLRGRIDQLAIGTPEHDAALAEFMTAIAAWRNRPGGFWVAAATPEAAHQAITGMIEARDVHRAALLSDGATRLVDRFDHATWPQLLDLAANDPADLITRTRNLELTDPHGRRWPRGKTTDDATIAYLTAIHDGADAGTSRSATQLTRMLPPPTTSRLDLRVLRPEDAETLSGLLSDPYEWIKNKIDQQQRRGFSPWAVIDRDRQSLIGFCGLFFRERYGITLGYAILPEARGHGLATEAADAVLTWAEQHKLDVHASIRPPNPASQRVLNKIGMRLCERQHDADGERLVYRRRTF